MKTAAKQMITGKERKALNERAEVTRPTNKDRHLVVNFLNGRHAVAQNCEECDKLHWWFELHPASDWRRLCDKCGDKCIDKLKAKKK